jgi:hypothetical protein
MSYEYRPPSLRLIDTATLLKQGAEAVSPPFSPANE